MAVKYLKSDLIRSMFQIIFNTQLDAVYWYFHTIRFDLTIEAEVLTSKIERELCVQPASDLDGFKEIQRNILFVELGRPKFSHSEITRL